MRGWFTIVLFYFGFLPVSGKAQPVFKEYKVGHPFSIKLPDYMQKTIGLNEAAVFQFKCSEKDMAGIVMVDSKDELRMAGLTFANPEEFYADFVKDFLVEEESKKITFPLSKEMGPLNFVEAEASYWDKELKMGIAYFIGVVETPLAFYQLLCWGSIENENKYKPDFQAILYSIRD